MKNEIHRWLENKEKTIDSGLYLLDKYGRNKTHIQNLKRQKGNQRILNTLIYELDKIANPAFRSRKLKTVKTASSAKEKKQTAKKEEPKTSRPDPNPEPIPKDVPGILEPFYEKKKKLYVEVRNIQSKLCYNNKQDERKQMAGNILEIWDEINECWRNIDYYHKFKKLPEAGEVTPEPKIKADITDKAELKERLRTIRTYISKAKKKPEKYEHVLMDYTAEKEAILKILEKFE